MRLVLFSPFSILLSKTCLTRVPRYFCPNHTKTRQDHATAKMLTTLLATLALCNVDKPLPGAPRGTEFHHPSMPCKEQRQCMGLSL